MIPKVMKSVPVFVFEMMYCHAMRLMDTCVILFRKVAVICWIDRLSVAIP